MNSHMVCGIVNLVGQDAYKLLNVMNLVSWCSYIGGVGNLLCLRLSCVTSIGYLLLPADVFRALCSLVAFC